MRALFPFPAVLPVPALRSSPPPAPRAGETGRLTFADGLRGLAALWVVLFHASEGGHLTELKKLLPRPLVSVVFDLGHLGVAIFFVLSGFVMAYTVQSRKADAHFATGFVARRMVRLTPPYWASIAFVLVLLAVKRAAQAPWSSLPDPATVSANATYLQGILNAPSINTVYWTLGIEVQFYLAFAALLVVSERLAAHVGRTQARLLVMSATTAVALLWPMGLVADPIWSGGFAPFWFSFASGVLVCWTLQSGEPVATRIAAALLVPFAIGALAGGSPFAVTSTLTAIALFAAGRLGRMHAWLSWRWLQFLGLVSYSLYLLHNPLTGAGFAVVHRILPGGLLAELSGLAASLALCVAVSALAFRLVERPAQRWSHAIPVGSSRVG